MSELSSISRKVAKMLFDNTVVVCLDGRHYLNTAEMLIDPTCTWCGGKEFIASSRYEWNLRNEIFRWMESLGLTWEIIPQAEIPDIGNENISFFWRFDLLVKTNCKDLYIEINGNTHSPEYDPNAPKRDEAKYKALKNYQFHIDQQYWDLVTLTNYDCKKKNLYDTVESLIFDNWIIDKYFFIQHPNAKIPIRRD